MNTPQNATTTPAALKRILESLLVWLLGIVLLIVLLVAAGLFWLWIKFTEPYLWGFGPREMGLARYTPKDVVGDLGGMKVTIPRHIPELVQYDGDPSWGEKRKGPRPERTHDSKLMAFGFKVRYPDMATLSSPEMWADKKAQKTYETMWLSVLVSTGQNYPRGGALDSAARYVVEDWYSSLTPWLWHYTQLPQKKYGLTVYTLQDINPQTGKPAREDRDADDAYIAGNDKGQVTTFIKCKVHFKHAHTCQHSFNMEHDGVKALIEVHFRPGLLTHWRDIQARLTRFILDFKATPESITPSAASQAATTPPTKN